MAQMIIAVKKFAILCHRWMGVTFCVLFAWWFWSGIFMMYWDYPSVSQSDRLERALSLDASKIQLSPADAWTRSGQDGSPGGVTLTVFDGRPVYRFAAGGRDGRRRGGSMIVYADDGTIQSGYRDDLLLRMAAAWTRQPPSAAKIEEVTEADQWTIEMRNRLPLTKYSFPDGQQVYMSKPTGEILQYTTTGSRIGAYLGPIPHWIYYTPLRVQQELWSNLIIYASGIGTIVALLGLVVGIWMYSPSKKYRFEGSPTSIPYSGQKRLHMILGLFFGIITCTWAFSGMLSMDPPFLTERRPPPAPGGARERGGGSVAAKIQGALRPSSLDLSAYEAKPPQAALAQLGALPVKELELTSFDGEPVYSAAVGSPGNTNHSRAWGSQAGL